LKQLKEFQTASKNFQKLQRLKVNFTVKQAIFLELLIGDVKIPLYPREFQINFFFHRPFTLVLFNYLLKNTYYCWFTNYLKKHNLLTAAWFCYPSSRCVILTIGTQLF